MDFAGEYARAWFNTNGFRRYVDEGDEDEILRDEYKFVWTHYDDFLNGQFVTNGFVPDKDGTLGYFVMEQVSPEPLETEFIQIVEVVECEVCDNGYDADGNHCVECNGGEKDFLEGLI